jgi:hypothetical protein
VAVFSGPARQQIPDASFASDDTNVTTGRKHGLHLTTTGKILGKSKTIFSPPAGLTEVPPQNAGRAARSSVAVIVIANMLMLWVSGIFGWDVFGHIWPMELVVVGVLLVALMGALPSAWLLLPGGIMLGNGFLLSYFALSGQWRNWTFLWPLEPLLIAASIIAPFLLNRRGTAGLWLTRRLSNILRILSGIVFVISMLVGILSK